MSFLSNDVQLSATTFRFLFFLNLKLPKQENSLNSKFLSATGIARSISPGQVLRQDSSSAMMSGSNVATIIRAHSVQQSSNQPPQPPVKKGQFGAANATRVPPPIPPNKPIINKGNATSVTTNSSRISFLQSQTVPGVSSAAQAIAAQNAKDGDE